MFRRLPLAAACAFALVGIVAIPADTPARRDDGAAARGAQTAQSGAAFNLADYHQWRDNLDHRGGIGGFRADAPTTNGAGDNGANFGNNNGANFQTGIHTGDWHFNLPTADLADLSGFAADAINNGKDNALADLYQQTRLRMLSDFDAALSRGAESVITGNFAAVKRAGVRVRSKVGERKGNFGVNVVGSFADSDTSAFGWQVRGYVGDKSSKGANAGLFYRLINNRMLFGANAFADYEDDNYGGFSRYSIGGEVRHQWFGFNANYYKPITDDKRVNATVAAFSRQGYDAQVRIAMPDDDRVRAAVDYYAFDGKHGGGSDKGVRFGAEMHPVPGVQFGLYYDENAEDFYGDVHIAYTIGEAQARQSNEGFAPDLFAPISREYAQRIALATVIAASSPPVTPPMTMTMEMTMSMTMTTGMTMTMTADMTMSMTMTTEMTMTMAPPPPPPTLAPSAELVINDHPLRDGILWFHRPDTQQQLANLDIDNRYFDAPPEVNVHYETEQRFIPGSTNRFNSILAFIRPGVVVNIPLAVSDSGTLVGDQFTGVRRDISLRAQDSRLNFQYRYNGTPSDGFPRESLRFEVVGDIDGVRTSIDILSVTVQGFYDIAANAAASAPFIVAGGPAGQNISRISHSNGYGDFTYQLDQPPGNNYEIVDRNIRNRNTVPAVSITYPPTTDDLAVLTVRINDSSPATPEVTITTTVKAVSPVSATVRVVDADADYFRFGGRDFLRYGSVYALGGAGTPHGGSSDSPGGRGRGYDIVSRTPSDCIVAGGVNGAQTPLLTWQDSVGGAVRTCIIEINDLTGGSGGSGDPATQILATPAFSLTVTVTLL